MKILIATTKVPSSDEFFGIMQGLAQSMGLVLIGCVGCHAGSCYNVAMDVDGKDKDAEKFANAVTGAFGPIARWTTTSDPIVGFKMDYEGVPGLAL